VGLLLMEASGKTMVIKYILVYNIVYKSFNASILLVYIHFTVGLLLMEASGKTMVNKMFPPVVLH